MTYICAYPSPFFIAAQIAFENRGIAVIHIVHLVC